VTTGVSAAAADTGAVPSTKTLAAAECARHTGIGTTQALLRDADFHTVAVQAIIAFAVILAGQHTEAGSGLLVTDIPWTAGTGTLLGLVTDTGFIAQFDPVAVQAVVAGRTLWRWREYTGISDTLVLGAGVAVVAFDVEFAAGPDAGVRCGDSRTSFVYPLRREKRKVRPCLKHDGLSSIGAHRRSHRHIGSLDPRSGCDSPGLNGRDRRYRAACPVRLGLSLGRILMCYAKGNNAHRQDAKDRTPSVNTISYVH